MKELGEALKVIFEKIAGFLDIFDLSFFVSGAVGFGALLYWLSSAGVNPPTLDGWARILAVLLSCYVSGLLCFAGGRWVRMFLFRRWYSVAAGVECVKALRGHGLQNEQVFAEYIGRPDESGSWRLYSGFGPSYGRHQSWRPRLAF